jgi:hypothetical protein
LWSIEISKWPLGHWNWFYIVWWCYFLDILCISSGNCTAKFAPYSSSWGIYVGAWADRVHDVTLE